MIGIVLSIFYNEIYGIYLLSYQNNNYNIHIYNTSISTKLVYSLLWFINATMTIVNRFMNMMLNQIT